MRKIFTKIGLMAAFGFLAVGSAFAQGAIGWGGLGLGEYPMVINENFQNWTKTHSVATQEMITAGGAASVSDTWQQGKVEIPVYNNETNTGRTFTLGLVSASVAPDFYGQYYYDDRFTAYPKDLASKGFVELGRLIYAPIAPSPGELIIPRLDFCEGLQYSYTSSGGNKRGFKLLKSLDNGATWLEVRHETGNMSTGTSGTDVYASGYGLRFEEVSYEYDVMYKFTISDAPGSGGNQIVRIHDLRVYGEIADGNTSIEAESADSFKVNNSKQDIYLSSEANVQLYSMAGMMVKSAQNVTKLNIEDLPSGVYVVKATAQDGTLVSKKIVK